MPTPAIIENQPPPMPCDQITMANMGRFRFVITHEMAPDNDDDEGMHSDGPNCDEDGMGSDDYPTPRLVARAKPIHVGRHRAEDDAEAIHFRLRDDDGVCYFEGTMWASPSADEDTSFAPLDWAMHRYGCTTMDVWEDGKWSRL